MWGERPVRGEAQEFRGGGRGRGAGGREGGRWRWGEGRGRRKLSQGDDVDENLPLQKGAPKREFRRSLESTQGFVLEADLKAGSGGWGRESSRPTEDTRPGRRNTFFTEVNRMLFCQCVP